MMRSAVAASIGVAAALLVASCSSSSPKSSSPDSSSTTTTVVAQTPEGLFADALASRLSADGTIDKQLALDLYASAYGHAAELGANPLPGTNADGTQALTAVLAHWDELTAAQQAVINADLAVAPVRSVTVDPSAGGGGGSVRLPRRYDDPLATLVENAANQIGVEWGSRLPVRVGIEYMSTDLPATAGHGPPLADTRPVTASGDVVTDPTTYARCVVRVYPALTRVPDAIDQFEAMAHEVFHCFQFVGRNLGTLHELGEWVVEGQAEWAGATISGGGSVATGWWREWLTRDRALWTRTYDAIGIYASLARRGENVWNVFQRMLDGSPGFASMYATMAGSRGTAFLGDVAVDHSALSQVGAPWIPVGPGAPTDVVGALTDVAPGVDFSFDPYEVKAFDTAADAVQIHDPVVIVASDTAPWAVGVAGDYQAQLAAGEAALCLQSECRCPDGQLLAARAVGDHQVVGIGVANVQLVTATVNVHVTSLPLDAACARLPRASAGPDACLIGRWQLTEQIFGAEFLPGIAAAGLSGGIGGRVLVIRSDGTYTMTDDGSDPTVGNSTVGGIAVAVTIVLTGQVDGTVTVAGDQATFASTSTAVHLHAEETITGAAPIVIDQDLTDASLFGNGQATVTCGGNSLSLAFANATFRYHYG